MGLDFLRDFIFIGESVPLHMNQKCKKREAIIWLLRLTLTTVILAVDSFLLCLQLRRPASGLVTAAK